jgi:hypothetical protein
MQRRNAETKKLGQHPTGQVAPSMDAERRETVTAC